jgi:hypothetical protein
VGVRANLSGVKDDAGAKGRADFLIIFHDMAAAFKVSLHTSVLKQKGRRPEMLELLQSTQDLQEGVEGA